MSIQRVTVYAASSQALDAAYVDAAARLGRALGRAGVEIVYGAGGSGLMGAVAGAALDAGGRVHGVIPEFLMKLERAHQDLTSLEVVPDMRIRKEKMLENSDAVIALPGGCGTFEELFEAMTLKRLGQYFGPIVLVNTGGYYDRLLEFLRHSVAERFMSSIHLELWHCVAEPEQVVEALGKLEPWTAEAIEYAGVKAGSP